MTDYEISDPPESNLSRIQPGWLLDYAAFVKEHPNQWVKAPKVFPSSPGMRTSQLKKLGLETTTRKLGDKRYGLWARLNAPEPTS